MQSVPPVVLFGYPFTPGEVAIVALVVVAIYLIVRK